MDQQKTQTLKNGAKIEKAIFAAGCFWGVQSVFDKVKGVVKTTVGYTGGTTKKPTYKQICTGTTGHAEAILVDYDPAQISYEKLVDYFWRMHNPTTLNRQGPDVGTQYRSAIFYYDENQKAQAMASKERAEKSAQFSKPITTQFAPASKFYPAEEYHQKYSEKNGGAGCRLIPE